MTTEYTNVACLYCGDECAKGRDHMCRALEIRVREIAREVLNDETTWSKLDPVMRGWCKHAVLEHAPSLNQMREIAREEIRAVGCDGDLSMAWASPAIDKMEGMVPASEVQPDESERIKLRDRVINDLRVHVAHLEGTQNPHRCDFVADRARDEALEEAAALPWCDVVERKSISSTLHMMKSQPVTFHGIEIPPHPQREEIIKPAAQASADGPVPLVEWQKMEQEIATLRKERDTLRAKLAAAEKALDEIQRSGPWNPAFGVGAALQRTGRLQP